MESENDLPRLSPSAVNWLARYKPKLVILDNIQFGEDIEETKEFHNNLMKNDVNFM